MTAQAPNPAQVCGVARLPSGAPRPTPWFTDDNRSLDCELCVDVVAALWPLGSYPPDTD